MSVNNVDVFGFILKDEFDEGCQALKQLSPTSSQTVATMEIHEKVN